MDSIVNESVKVAQTTPGKIAIDTATAMVGGAATALAPNSTAIKLLDKTNTFVSIASGAQTEGSFGAVNAATKEMLTFGATSAGQAVGASAATAAGTTAGSVTMGSAIVGAATGGALAAGTLVLSYEIGENYIAPHIAPRLGTAMFNLAPGLFTPVSMELHEKQKKEQAEYLTKQKDYWDAVNKNQEQLNKKIQVAIGSFAGPIDSFVGPMGLKSNPSPISGTPGKEKNSAPGK